ncbi:MAG: ATP-binding protein, partial [Candidatus Thorarchaeota archaeon]
AELLEDITKDDNVRRILADIQNSSKNAIDLVNDLMRLSRISYQEIKPEIVDISKVVSDIVNELKKSDPERKVAVKIQEGMEFNCDRELVKIALHNLVYNSWKFTAKNPNAEIEIGVITEVDVPTIFVKDNGIGFSPEEASSIFEPFKRSKRSESYQGTGIGLTIVQRIVNAHSGRIWAESTPSKGSTFFFTLEPP